MKMQVTVTNIKWDTDNEVVSLPEEVIVEAEAIKDREELEEFISNFLSDTYGFCHFYYEYEVKYMKAKSQEKDKAISQQYRLSNMDELYKAYGRASQAKWNAWENCKRLCREYSGWGLKVISKNCHFFSAGFLFTDEETGVVRIMKITAYGHEVYDYI